jgi:hypothetical protein
MPYITVGKDLTDVSFWKGRSNGGVRLACRFRLGSQG